MAARVYNDVGHQFFTTVASPLNERRSERASGPAVGGGGII